ncbi:MAG: hypothetical protein JWM27_4859 [Gemmatimonadetes bacterium]|nr:hypothetical protein [Gemmatimonadota bacterium]
MRYEFRTFVERFKMFEPGERIRPASPRCELPPGGEYVVVRCIEPITPGYDSIVFVEGHARGADTGYLRSVEDDRDPPAGPEDGILALGDMLASAAAGWTRIEPLVLKAGHDRDGVLDRLLAFVEAYGLGPQVQAYLEAQHRRQAADSRGAE